MARQKKTVAEKVQADFPEFSTEVANLTVEELNTRLSNMVKELEESESHKEDNEALEEAKALASELAAPYRDVKKAVHLKSRYIVGLLRDKGKA
jgi:hypothetical protein